MPTATVQEKPRRTHCPVCGAKIARQDLSICSYCASPLDLIDRPEQEDGESAGRAAKVRSHKDLEESLRWTPQDLGEGARLRSRRRGGLGLAVLGAAVLTLAFLPWSEAGPLWGKLLFGGLLLAAGLARALPAQMRLARRGTVPLLRRPAFVADRRSQTSARGWGWRSQTTYYFKLVFEDGLRAEFGFPGRGAAALHSLQKETPLFVAG